MTRRRRRSRWGRKQQRTLLQIAILVIALAFVGLYNPIVRAGVNATLEWLVIRGLILGVIVLAIMWTYQFCRPPKVKRRTIKQPIPHRRSARHGNQAIPGDSPTIMAPNNGSPVIGATTTPIDAQDADYLYPTGQRSAPSAPTSDDLINQPMSGAHRYRP